MSRQPAPLDRLEELVAQSSARLRELHEENAELRRRVAAFESEAAEHAGGDQDVSAWQSERDELVGRVERLVSGLDELLATVEHTVEHPGAGRTGD
jgi:uncharacterized coiled-coil DUF342 family protein